MNNTEKNQVKKEIKPAVTVIGLGLMGHSLAHTFLKAGYITNVWNRSPKKAEDLVAEGAIQAKTINKAISSASILVVCVSTYEVLADLLSSISNKLAGRVIINLTSGTPEDARKMAEWVKVHNAEYLDGAIMAVPPMIGTPEALIFYGGRQALFEKYEPMLKLLGGNTVYLGSDTGLPLLYDLALLTILYGVQQSWLHAHALVKTAGISATKFQPFVEEWLKHVILPGFATHDAGRMLDERDYKTEVSNLNTNILALEHILKASKELNIPFNWMLPLKASYDQLIAEGFGNDSPERVFEHYHALESN